MSSHYIVSVQDRWSGETEKDLVQANDLLEAVKVSDATKQFLEEDPLPFLEDLCDKDLIEALKSYFDAREVNFNIKRLD